MFTNPIDFTKMSEQSLRNRKNELQFQLCGTVNEFRREQILRRIAEITDILNAEIIFVSCERV